MRYRLYCFLFVSAGQNVARPTPVIYNSKEFKEQVRARTRIKREQKLKEVEFNKMRI